MSELVEKIAAACWKETADDWARTFPDKAPIEPWSETTEACREHWRIFARTAVEIIMQEPAPV